jgi:hypothetical protein
VAEVREEFSRRLTGTSFEWSEEIGDATGREILGSHYCFYSKTFIKLVSIQTPIQSANLQEQP